MKQKINRNNLYNKKYVTDEEIKRWENNCKADGMKIMDYNLYARRLSIQKSKNIDDLISTIFAFIFGLIIGAFFVMVAFTEAIFSIF